jgi:hypothetical protein
MVKTLIGITAVALGAVGCSPAASWHAELALGMVEARHDRRSVRAGRARL